jgi:hypothetical protein
MNTSKTIKNVASKSAGLKVRSLVKAGGFGVGNHNRKSAGLKVRSLVKAGGFGVGNHNRGLLA